MTPEEPAAVPRTPREPDPSPGRNPRILIAVTACLLLLLGIGCTVSNISALRRAKKPGRPAYPGDLEKLCLVDRGVTLRNWQYIVIHHSGNETGNAATIDSYHRLVRRWRNGLGYDFVVGNGSRSGDGEIEVGHRWREQTDGAHCKADDMNKKGIGICFVGDFENGPPPTLGQISSGTALVRWLSAKFAIPPERILGHGNVDGAETKCPGRLFPLGLLSSAAAGASGPVAPPREIFVLTGSENSYTNL